MINRLRPDLYAGKVEALRVEKRYLKKSGEPVCDAFPLAMRMLLASCGGP